MTHAMINAHCAARPKRKPNQPKPFTEPELTAKAFGETYLALAMSYRSREDTMNALACCLEGLVHTIGISRPLAVRDQLDDLIKLLDPTLKLRRSIRPDNWHPIAATFRAPNAARGHTHLERLVSVHQLIMYPSTDCQFNCAYTVASRCVTRRGLVHELYLVRKTAPAQPEQSRTDQQYCVVDANSISEHGPYYLTDICAVVRTDGSCANLPSLPRNTLRGGNHAAE